VTNGDTDPGEVGLGAYFAHAANAPRVGSAKPDPVIFHTVLEALGAVAGDAVHVGDSPHHDVAGAHRAGMHAVLLDRHHTTHPERLAGEERPDAVINTLEELPELLSAWDAATART
jgi:putative hydrolase of the HAD superfamily